MVKAYKHLTVEERDMIAVCKAEGKSLKQIGEITGKHKSTISRELKRNAPDRNKGYYLGHKAQQRAQERWLIAHQRTRLKSQEIRDYIHPVRK